MRHSCHQKLGLLPSLSKASSPEQHRETDTESEAGAPLAAYGAEGGPPETYEGGPSAVEELAMQRRTQRGLGFRV